MQSGQSNDLIHVVIVFHCLVGRLEANELPSFTEMEKSEIGNLSILAVTTIRII